MTQDAQGRTPFDKAASYNPNPAVITTLLNFVEDVNARKEIGRTLLQQAAWLNDNPDVIVTLLTAGADLGALDRWGQALLHKSRPRTPIPKSLPRC